MRGLCVLSLLVLCNSGSGDEFAGQWLRTASRQHSITIVLTYTIDNRQIQGDLIRSYGSLKPSFPVAGFVAHHTGDLW